MSGAFDAVNTNFSVIDSDEEALAAGTVVRGGEVRSGYKVAGEDYALARLGVRAAIGGVAVPELSVLDHSGTDKTYPLPSKGGELVA